MLICDIEFKNKERFWTSENPNDIIRHTSLITAAARKALSVGANRFRKEVQKSFTEEMGHYPHKAKKHANTYAKLLAGIGVSVRRNKEKSTAKISIMGHPLLHLFETGAGDGHYKKTRSYKDTRSKSGKHKLGRPRKYASNTLFGSKTLGDGTKVRVTAKGESRGRIEGIHFFKKVKENPSIMNEVTKVIETRFRTEMVKLLKRFGL